MNPIDLLPKPENTLQAIDKIMNHVEAPQVREQRISVRQQVLQPIAVQPLNEHFEPIDAPFEALSRDVSVAGVGFFATEAVNTQWLSLDFTACDHASVIVELAHQHRRGPFWIIGCKFLVNWDAANWEDVMDDEFLRHSGQL
ncbi:hypothetical protein [Planctomycetes bacterium K23_9]|uniref:PilZ domain-containing protein n=1 Tax=Stieleria marina TaxID=1930275 RepID=A0A517NT37_9BACT|nr:hypothetical protein K239x_22400 [Planctomycetes bacterium K23_9]